MHKRERETERESILSNVGRERKRAFYRKEEGVQRESILSKMRGERERVSIQSKVRACFMLPLNANNNY